MRADADDAAEKMSIRLAAEEDRAADCSSGQTAGHILATKS
jgi:hypothetical protein